MIASSDGRIVSRGGDFAALQSSYLVRSLFGGTEEVLSLFDFLKGKKLPQISQQGEIYCVLIKPTADTAVGFFAQDGRDLLTLYREGKEVSKALGELLNPEAGDPQT